MGLGIVLDVYGKSDRYRCPNPGPSSPYRVAVPTTLSRPPLLLGAYLKICRENPGGKNIGHFALRPRYVLLLPAILNHDKSALFD